MSILINSQTQCNATHKRVLLIEDTPDIRETLRMLLELWGYQVDDAADGEEGLAKAVLSPPDVALIDIGLPRISGLDVARRLRADMGDKILLIALTGFGHPSDRRRSKAAGFDAHLVKPLDLDRLGHLLQLERNHCAFQTV